MSTHLIIDGNAVYEIDEGCMEQKKSMQKDRVQRDGIQKDRVQKDRMPKEGVRKERRAGQDDEGRKDPKVRYQE